MMKNRALPSRIHNVLAASLAIFALLYVTAYGPGGAAYAQVSSATVSGTVLDPAGAIVPNAKVIVTNVLTGVPATVVTNSAGVYNVPFLLPGTYSVNVDLTGFKKFTESGLTLAVGDHPTVDVHLEIGASDQTVTVTATTPLLQTEDDSLGSLITNKQIDGLPLNGRTPMAMAQFAAGVVSTTNPGLVRAFDNSAVSAFSVAGLPNKNAEILLDGSPDNASDNAIAYSPTVDSVEQLKINVFESDAGFGHSGGGVANQITKSGTNRLHGSLYEFNENSALNANNYFNNRNHSKKGVSRQNQYGGSVGGPVVFPKLFNGRDKLFFFYAYEGYKDSGPNYQTLTVPTAAERTGDFSALLPLGCPSGYQNGNAAICANGSSNPYQLYNPNTATLSGTTVIRQPIPGNVLSNAGLSISPIAANILKLYPLPGAGLGDAFGNNNYFSPFDNGDTYFNHFARGDYEISSKNRLSLTYRYNKRVQFVNQEFGPGDPAIGDSLTRINHGGSIFDVYTLSNSLIGSTRLNYTRYVQNQVPLAQGFGASSLGFPSYIQNTATDLIFPRINLGYFLSLGVPTTSYSLAPFENYDIYSDLLKTIKSHTIKFGVDLRRYQKGQLTAGNSQGQFTFGNNYVTPTSSGVSDVIGQDLASLEIGLPTGGSYDINSKTFGTTDYMAYFIQDDWRVRSDLVLNIGLRFDHDFPAYERYGRAINGFSNAPVVNGATGVNISAAAQAAYSAHPIPQLPAASFVPNGGLTFASPSSPNTYKSLSKTFSPRLGFSYTPSALGRSTSIRGGFGLFVLPLFPFNNGFNTSGFSQTTSLVPSTNGFLTPSATLANPFPSTNPILQPTGSTLGEATFLGQNLTYFEPNAKNGYSERWNLGIQHQFPGKTLVEATYLANHAVKLPINYSPNFIPAQYLFSTAASIVPAVGTTPTPAQAFGSSSGATNPFKGLEPGGSLNTASTTSQAQLLAVYPQFPGYGVTVQYAPYGSSYFEALDIRLEKRSSFGLTAIANYQWSKLLERVSYLNPTDPAPELRISQYDHPTHFVGAVTYELPYGRRRMFGANASRFLDLPLGGWIVNGIYTYQQGAPLTFGNVVFTGAPLNLQPRQTAPGVPGLNTAAIYTGSIQPSYNIRTTPSQFSNYRFDAIDNLDASVSKDFNFTENTFLQIRFEAFNANNRPQFGGPNLSPTSGSFGIINSTANNSRVIQVGAKIEF